MDNFVWIFGYGSLMWKPPQDMRYSRMTLARLKNYHRFFWQLSTDHRGVPSNPGRVVTLTDQQHETSDCEECWGVAYQIPKEDWESHLASLDHREKNGYERRLVNILIWNSKKSNKKNLNHEQITPYSDVEAVIYYASNENEFYSEITDEHNHEEIAHGILHIQGPSGRNIEYFAKVYMFELLMNNLQTQTLALYRHIHKLHQDLRIKNESDAKKVDGFFTLPEHLMSMIQEYLSEHPVPCEELNRNM